MRPFLVLITLGKLYSGVRMYLAFFHVPRGRADRVFMVLRYENIHWSVHETKPNDEKFPLQMD